MSATDMSTYIAGIVRRSSMTSPHTRYKLLCVFFDLFEARLWRDRFNTFRSNTFRFDHMFSNKYTLVHRRELYKFGIEDCPVETWCIVEREK
jgi:hypothetical protein